MHKKVKKALTYLTATAALVGMGSCGYMIHQGPQPRPGIDYAAQIQNANQLTIDEAGLRNMIPFTGKRYYIEKDGDPVGYVQGKSIKMFGDVFTIHSLDGQVLGSEEEEKRYFLKFERSAVVKDAQGNERGFMVQEKIRDMFSFYYNFHFYDADKKPIGVSKKLTNSVFGDHPIEDMDGNEDYDIDKRVSWLNPGQLYVITKKDAQSQIPWDFAIHITCIEDAIADSIRAKESSKE